MKTWLFNPFKYIAGGKSLLLGIAGMLITSIACYFGAIHLDGIIDMHKSATINFSALLIEPALDWLSFAVTLYIFGRMLSVSSVRFIDVAGTTALARYPLFFAAIITIFFIPDIKTPQEVLNAIQTNPDLIVKLAIMGLAVLPFIIWTVALMFNAYSVSTNLKGTKAVWSFIVSLFIAEVFSKVLLTLLFK